MADAVAALAAVMPWLNPKDLAALALTCRALAAASASLTSLRAKDVARGLERLPVPVYNAVDNALYPLFSYSPFSILRSTPPLYPWGSLSRSSDKIPSCESSAARSAQPSSEVCTCFASHSYTQILDPELSTRESQDCLEAEFLPAAKRQRQSVSLCGKVLGGEFAYDSNARLQCFTTVSQKDEQIVSRGFLSIMECGPACSCTLNCQYRVTQRGLAAKVAVCKDQLKGWSLQAMQSIKKGTFVFEFAGELLTTVEAQNRQIRYDQRRKLQKGFSPSLLVLREHLPSGKLCLRLNIDATHVGNVARFVNHSCDGGNLEACIVRLSGCPIPKLAFFAKCDIAEGEELTFSYGEEYGSEAYQCFCKTASCKGYLPFEAT